MSMTKSQSTEVVHHANRVLFAEHRQPFWTRMDQNYRHKYERVHKLLHPHPLTVVDLPTAASEMEVSRYAILLVGVFAIFAAQQNPPLNPVPDFWLKQIKHRCAMLEDLAFLPELIDLLDNRYQYLISTYDCKKLTSLCEDLSSLRKTYVIPHHVDTDIYKDAGLPKIHDVLFYGNDDPRSYPFRYRLRKILEASRLKVRIIEHPDYHAVDPERCGEALSRAINQSWISIATPTIHDYLVAKYFEISASGAVVAGRMATQGKPIWQDNYVQLGPEMSDREIMDRLSAALEDKELLRHKSAVMGELVRREYSLDRYVERLAAVLQDVARDAH